MHSVQQKLPHMQFYKSYHICNSTHLDTYPNTLVFHNPCTTKDNHNQRNQYHTFQKLLEILLINSHSTNHV